MSRECSIPGRDEIELDALNLSLQAFIQKTTEKVVRYEQPHQNNDTYHSNGIISLKICLSSRIHLIIFDKAYILVNSRGSQLSSQSVSFLAAENWPL